MIASTADSGRASSRTDSALAAAVRSVVRLVPSSIACTSPVTGSVSSTVAEISGSPRAGLSGETLTSLVATGAPAAARAAYTSDVA